MDVKTQALDRVLEALSPALTAELERAVHETRESTREKLEQEFQVRLEAAVHEAETTTASVAQTRLERAVEQAKEQTREQTKVETQQETRRLVTAELEQQFKMTLEAKLDALSKQLRAEAAEEKSRLEATMAQLKSEWSGELSKREDEREQWQTFAEAQRQLAEASSQPEILSRFLRLAQPFADGLALYINKAEGLALWKSAGKGVFPEIISKETTDPESYFRSITVRGKTVGAICATPSFKAHALDFLAGSLERAIEVFGLKLRTPVPKPAAAEAR